MTHVIPLYGIPINSLRKRRKHIYCQRKAMRERASVISRCIVTTTLAFMFTKMNISSGDPYLLDIRFKPIFLRDAPPIKCTTDVRIMNVLQSQALYAYFIGNSTFKGTKLHSLVMHCVSLCWELVNLLPDSYGQIFSVSNHQAR